MSRKYDHDEAVKRYEAGASIMGLAAEYGVTESAVRNMLQRRGVELRGTTRTFDYKKAARMYEAGVLVVDIAEQLGTTEASVRRALRLQKVKTDPKHRAVANAARRKLDDTDVTLIALWRSTGWSWQDIADELEVNKSTAYQAYQRWRLEQLEKEAERAKAERPAS